MIVRDPKYAKAKPSTHRKLEELFDQIAKGIQAKKGRSQADAGAQLATQLVTQTAPRLDGRVQVRTAQVVTQIQHLHRAEESWIHFLHRRPGEDRLRYIGAVQVGELQEMFPSFREHLAKDAFMTVQGIGRSGKGRSSLVPGMAAAHHNVRSVSHINAVFADIDCHRKGLRFREDVQPLLQLILRKMEIPQPSMISDSGRGGWLLWLLHDPDDPDRPPRADWQATATFAAIEREIVRRLAEYGADTGTDLARSTRVPGSVNSRSGTKVRWMLNAIDGRVEMYTLPQLASALNLEVRRIDFLPRPVPSTQGKLPGVVNNTMSALGKKGWLKRASNVLDDLEKLRALRGGVIREGNPSRSIWMLIYAYTFVKLKYSDADIHEMLFQLNDCCQPPVEPSALRQAIKGARRPRGLLQIRHDTIATRLEITRWEAERLDHLPAADGWLPPSKGGRANRQVERQEIIRRAWSGISRDLRDGKPPTVRDMRAAVAARGLYEPSTKTVLDDIRALDARGLLDPPPRRKRPVEPSRQAALPLPPPSA